MVFMYLVSGFIYSKYLFMCVIFYRSSYTTQPILIVNSSLHHDVLVGFVLGTPKDVFYPLSLWIVTLLLMGSSNLDIPETNVLLDNNTNKSNRFLNKTYFSSRNLAKVKNVID